MYLSFTNHTSLCIWTVATLCIINDPLRSIRQRLRSRLDTFGKWQELSVVESSGGLLLTGNGCLKLTMGPWLFPLSSFLSSISHLWAKHFCCCCFCCATCSCQDVPSWVLSSRVNPSGTKIYNTVSQIEPLLYKLISFEVGTCYSSGNLTQLSSRQILNVYCFNLHE